MTDIVIIMVTILSYSSLPDASRDKLGANPSTWSGGFESANTYRANQAR